MAAFLRNAPRLWILTAQRARTVAASATQVRLEIDHVAALSQTPPAAAAAATGTLIAQPLVTWDASLPKDSFRLLLQERLPTANADRILERGPSIRTIAARIDCTIQWLQSLGLTMQDIGLVVTRFPELLSYSVEDTLNRKVEIFARIGVDRRNFGKLVLRFPRVTARSSEKVNEILDFLIGLDINNEDILKVLLRSPRLLSRDVQKSLRPSVTHLENLGISRKQLLRSLVSCPSLLGPFSDSKHILEKTHLLLRLGLERESKCFGRCVFTYLCLNSDVLEARFNNFMGLGLSREQTVKLVYNYPGILRLKWDTIMEKVHFILNVMGKQIEEVISAPAILRQSLENRIRPRHAILIELSKKGLVRKEFPLTYTFLMSDAKFAERCEKWKQKGDKKGVA